MQHDIGIPKRMPNRQAVPRCRPAGDLAGEGAAHIAIDKLMPGLTKEFHGDQQQLLVECFAVGLVDLADGRGHFAEVSQK